MRDWATCQCTALDFYLSGRRFRRQTGVTAYLSLCLCGCARTLTWLFVLTTDSSSIRVFQTHVQPLLKQPSRPESQCSECVSVFLCHRAHLSLVCTAATKAGFVPLLPPPPLCATSPIQACDSSCFSTSWVNNTTARTCSTCLHLRPESNTLCTWHQNVAE